MWMRLTGEITISTFPGLPMCAINVFHDRTSWKAASFEPNFCVNRVDYDTLNSLSIFMFWSAVGQASSSVAKTATNRCKTKTVHEITAGHRSLSGTISCVTDRIRFLPVTMTGRFSNFNSISYTEDRHKLRVTGTKCRLPDTLSVTGEIFISGTVVYQFLFQNL